MLPSLDSLGDFRQYLHEVRTLSDSQLEKIQKDRYGWRIVFSVDGRSSDRTRSIYESTWQILSAIHPEAFEQLSYLMHVEITRVDEIPGLVPVIHIIVDPNNPTAVAAAYTRFLYVMGLLPEE